LGTIGGVCTKNQRRWNTKIKRGKKPSGSRSAAGRDPFVKEEGYKTCGGDLIKKKRLELFL